ncbi:carbohydrate ABC transporter permease [Athalassotoga saccharophila]|uniref:carbohydrate ABC transporter permease n=1 Tax=Athalassotoga saccharophila TaxID=1441386 RepID=UPI00137AB774|nr:carbohydrate ABC transporter permease [Athalassotoga saccharophila]BBJ27499.1 L-arabinose transport system permease protein AraQ [Athalassotoga saccharophila]
MKKVNIKQIIRYIVMSTIAAVFLFPIYWMFVSAIKPTADIFAVPPVFWPQKPVWSHFAEVFQQLPFARWIFNTAFVAGVITIVALFTHSMSAYSLSRLRYRGRNFMFIVVISTLMVPFSAVMVPLFILVRSFGWVNTYWALIVPGIPNAFGIFLLRQFYLGIPRELEEAAIMDGASILNIFFRIILPISKPILAALAVFFFLANWNNFLWPLIVINSNSLKMIQVGIAGYGGQYQNPWGDIMAADFMAMLPTLIIFIFLQKYLVTSITMSGLKE